MSFPLFKAELALKITAVYYAPFALAHIFHIPFATPDIFGIPRSYEGISIILGTFLGAHSIWNLCASFLQDAGPHQCPGGLALIGLIIELCCQTVTIIINIHFMGYLTPERADAHGQKQLTNLFYYMPLVVYLYICLTFVCEFPHVWILIKCVCFDDSSIEDQPRRGAPSTDESLDKIFTPGRLGIYARRHLTPTTPARRPYHRKITIKEEEYNRNLIETTEKLQRENADGELATKEKRQLIEVVRTLMQGRWGATEKRTVRYLEAHAKWKPGAYASFCREVRNEGQLLGHAADSPVGIKRPSPSPSRSSRSSASGDKNQDDRTSTSKVKQKSPNPPMRKSPSSSPRKSPKK